MLWALAFVAMREQQHDAVGTAPLDLARGDELVDHHLRAVDEVAELPFPDGQGVGLGGGVAVLEAQHSLLGQDRVDHHKRRLAVGDMLQRGVAADIPLFAVLVVQHSVAMDEGPAAAVFARQPHRVATGDQRRIGQGLAHAPVDVDVATAHRSAVGQHFFDQRMDLEVRRHRGHTLGQSLDLGQRQRSVGSIGPLLAEEW